MGNRITRTVLFAASALLSMSAFGAGAARFGTLRNSDWVVTNAWQSVSNKTHDLILEIGHDDSLTGIVDRAATYGTPTRWTDATGCVWQAGAASGIGYNEWTCIGVPQGYSFLGIDIDRNTSGSWRLDLFDENELEIDPFYASGDENPEYLIFDVLGAMVEARPNVTVTNLVGRVAMTSDIPDTSGYATQQQATNAAIAVADAKISTNNTAFVSAVLAVPIAGAVASDTAELAEYGSYGTVGAALLALIAGLAALKRRVTSAETAIGGKANATDLPYRLVEPGKWGFSGNGYDPTKTYDVIESGGSEYYSYDLVENGTIIESLIDYSTEQVLSVEFLVATDVFVTATRASLPGHLCNRANNIIDATTGNVTLTLPPFVDGKVRDLLVACTIGLDGNSEPWSVIFQGADGEEISFKAEGDDAASATFPVPDAAGDWWYSLTECAPHVFAVSLKQLQSVSQTQGGS